MFASLALAAQLGASPAPDFDWIAGYWLTCDGGREVSEIWTDARGGVFYNTTITVEDGRSRSERTVIALVDGAPAFIYEPTGEAVVFPAISLEPRRAVFENLDNDFPHRVIYSREGDVLTGRIEGVIDGETRAIEWVYQAASFNARC